MCMQNSNQVHANAKMAIQVHMQNQKQIFKIYNISMFHRTNKFH